MQRPQGDFVCEHCGVRLSVDMDFCPECGRDRGTPSRRPPAGTPATGPSQRPTAPPSWTPAPPPMATGAGPRRRVSVGLLLGIIGLILAIIAIASISWFTVESLEGSTSMDFGLKEVEYRYEGAYTQDTEQRESYKVLEAQMGDELTMDDVAGASFWILVTGLTLAGLFILFAFLVLIGAIRGSLTWLSLLSGLVAGVLIVVAASYFGIAFQDAMEEDIGYNLADEESADYGLGYAFYLALFGGILVLVGALLTKVPSAPSGQMYPMR